MLPLPQAPGHAVGKLPEKPRFGSQGGRTRAPMARETHSAWAVSSPSAGGNTPTQTYRIPVAWFNCLLRTPHSPTHYIFHFLISFRVFLPHYNVSSQSPQSLSWAWHTVGPQQISTERLNQDSPSLSSLAGPLTTTTMQRAPVDLLEPMSLISISAWILARTHRHTILAHHSSGHQL